MYIIAEREYIEVSSIYCPDNLLYKIIEKEDRQNPKHPAYQLTEALATITNKQKYAVKQFYCNDIKKIRFLRK